MSKEIPILSIELYDEDKPPVVKYQGEEVKYKTSIEFDWKTKTEEVGSGKLEYKVDYYENGDPKLVSIHSKRGVE